jgi:RNA-binding protein YhbY
MTSMQVGKSSLTGNFLLALKNAFNTHDTAKISVLKTATRSRDGIEKIAQELCTALGKKFTCKIVGFTIFIKKWRKPRQKAR